MGTRVTQIVSETLREGLPKARATQILAETLRVGMPKARVTRFAVETLRPSFVVWNVSASNTFSFDASATETVDTPGTTIHYGAASNSMELSGAASSQADLFASSSNALEFSVTATGLRIGPIFASASSSFALSSTARANATILADAASGLLLYDDAEQGTYRVSAYSLLLINPSVSGAADRFASATSHLNITAEIALGGGFIYAVSAFNTLSFKSIARSPMEYFVAARNTIYLVGTAGSHTSPIRVSASNSFTLSARASTKGPIYASAANSFKLSQDLKLKHLHVYRVSASNSFRMSSVASSLNHAVHHVSAASNFSLGSSASNVRDMPVSASNAFVLAVTSSQTRDIYAGAATTFSMQALPGSNNFYQLDAESTAQFFTSSEAVITGELAENQFALSSYAFAVVEFPWRRTRLTLPPGGGLPHS